MVLCKLILVVNIVSASADDWKASIAKYLNERGRSSNGPGIGSESACYLNTSECSWKSLPSVSRIYPPRSETGCIFGEEYGFDVYKRSSEKIVLYYQGGGACWNYVTTITDPMCSTALDENFSSVGIFDQENRDNPFANYSIIQVNYCSGDVHGGNKTTSYPNQNATQTGIANALSVLNWLIDQQSTGNIKKSLDKLVIAGSSAGSIGAQLWASNVTNQVLAQSFLLILDSYVGVFPQDIEATLFYTFGACPFMPTSQLALDCFNQNLHLYNITKAQLQLLPQNSTQFASLVSKRDYVQISYYDALEITSLHSDDLISPPQFYANFQQILELYTAHNHTSSQPVAFIVDSDAHTFLPQDYLYTTSVYGTTENISSQIYHQSLSSSHMMIQWLSALLDDKAKDTTTSTTTDPVAVCEQCFGEITPVPSIANVTDYCDSALAGRCTNI